MKNLLKPSTVLDRMTTAERGIASHSITAMEVNSEWGDFLGQDLGSSHSALLSYTVEYYSSLVQQL